MVKPDDLKDRIDAARAAGERHGSAAPGGGDPGIEGAMSFGLRAGAQFVSAVVIGGGLGWLIDHWLGTSPLAMLTLMVLSFVAALWNVWRSMSKAVAVAEIAAAKSESGQSGAPPEGGRE